MSSIIVLQVAAVGLVLACLFSVRNSLRAADGPKPAPAAAPAFAEVRSEPAPVEPPAPVVYDKPRLVASTPAHVPEPVRLAEDDEDDILSREEEVALLERERDAALQQSAAAWKLLVQTRAERDRLREDLDQARKALAEAEAARGKLEDAAKKPAKSPRRRAAQAALKAKSAS